MLEGRGVTGGILINYPNFKMLILKVIKPARNRLFPTAIFKNMGIVIDLLLMLLVALFIMFASFEINNPAYAIFNKGAINDFGDDVMLIIH